MTNSRISALKYTYASPTPEVVVVAFIINTGTVKQCYMLPLVCGTCTCTVHEEFLTKY